MNVPFFILIFIFFLLVIIFIIINFVLINKYQKNKTIESINIEDKCKININTLPNIEALKCCFISENITLNKYVPSLNMVVNPVQKPYMDVCKQFCKNGLTDLNTCVDNIGQDDFDNCIEISKPIDGCNDLSMPVAKDGITYYYPYNATDDICQITVPCQ